MSVYLKLYIPFVKLSDILVLADLHKRQEHVGKLVCMSDRGLQLLASTGASGLIHSEKMLRLARVTGALVQSHALCQKTSQTPELPQQLQHLKTQNLGSTALM